MKQILRKSSKKAIWTSEEGMLKVAAWCRDGLTQEQIAKNIGVRAETLCRWKEENDQFAQCIKTSRDIADIKVENAMFKAACGFTRKTEIIEQSTDDNSDGQQRIHKKIVKEEVPPDRTMAIFWLKNRKPDVWNDRTVMKVTDEDAHKLDELFASVKEPNADSKAK